MSDFLARLASRTLAPRPVLRPRAASVFADHDAPAPDPLEIDVPRDAAVPPSSSDAPPPDPAIAISEAAPVTSPRTAQSRSLAALTPGETRNPASSLATAPAASPSPPPTTDTPPPPPFAPRAVGATAADAVAPGQEPASEPGSPAQERPGGALVRPTPPVAEAEARNHDREGQHLHEGRRTADRAAPRDRDVPPAGRSEPQVARAPDRPRRPDAGRHADPALPAAPPRVEPPLARHILALPVAASSIATPAPPPPPEVNIVIHRLEVRAPAAQAKPAPLRRERTDAPLSLAAYLQSRSRE